MTSLTFDSEIHFNRRGRRGRKELRSGQEPTPPCDPGRVPRVARFMALALRFEGMLAAGEIGAYADLAELGQVSRARISQIMNLLNLAPDIVETILFLPRTEGGRDPIILCDLQSIASVLDWRKQRVLWKQLTRYNRASAV